MIRLSDLYALSVRLPKRLSLDQGYTAIEMLMATALAIILAAAAIPTGLTHVETQRLDGAARYIAAVLFSARAQAVKRSVFVGVRFESGGDWFATVLDGNRNGIRTRDIIDGVDPALTPRERLADRFQGVRFGIAARVTAIDSDHVLAEGSDPIQLGGADVISFNPLGSTTSGTLYVRSDHHQRAIRLLGATGRTRVLVFDRASGEWRHP
jgi:Tfp pilus assembly protein FimT